MTPQELSEFLKVMRQYGVMQAKIGDVELVLGPDPVQQKQDEEDLLFAAAR